MSPTNGTSTEPLVSIGVPVYNAEAFLERALDSLCAQDYEHLEIIISDNASTDNTLKICRAAAERDERVTYLTTDMNRGAAWNFSRLVHVAQGTYFKWAAADDLCRPELVSTCVAALEADPSAVLCYPRTSLIDEDDHVVSDFTDDLAYDDDSPVRRLARLCRHVGEYHAVFGVIRTAALRETGLLGAFVAADIVTVAELALRGRFLEHPDRLFLRRYHANTSVIANPDARSRAQWFDPSRRWRNPMPVLRLFGELLRAVHRSPLPPTRKLEADLVVLRDWALPRWRDLGGEFKRQLRAPTV
jgi:glycosyltransferase involved in cell wall biosynthesis